MQPVPRSKPSRPNYLELDEGFRVSGRVKSRVRGRGKGRVRGRVRVRVRGRDNPVKIVFFFRNPVKKLL